MVLLAFFVIDNWWLPFRQSVVNLGVLHSDNPLFAREEAEN